MDISKVQVDQTAVEGMYRARWWNDRVEEGSIVVSGLDEALAFLLLNVLLSSDPKFAVIFQEIWRAYKGE